MEDQYLVERHRHIRSLKQLYFYTVVNHPSDRGGGCKFVYIIFSPIYTVRMEIGEVGFIPVAPSSLLGTSATTLFSLGAVSMRSTFRLNARRPGIFMWNGGINAAVNPSARF